MMHRDGSADLAPDLDAVLTGRNACDVDARSARALHDVLHERGEASVLHELNASIPCDGGLKHHKTPRGRETFDFRYASQIRRTAGGSHQTIQLINTAVKAVPFNDGPPPQQAQAGAAEEREQLR